ncbi:unannotated protein [freshwater metagenome]|uniref:Threonylcarbamoyl-AMP synthase n=2 Tax=freshwater metagenome TaxID=449393 RepID=A0A6J7SK01_9ZZZZ
MRVISTSLEQAARALQGGALVAIPTETVYGLAADARNEAAVVSIYVVKGRPSSHPVIVHIADVDQLDEWAINIPTWARALAETFWPGPLTLILPRAAHVGDWITGGQESVGVRCPDHALTLALLRESGLGVAAPSANRFGSLSPTSAAAVLEELGEYLDPAEDLILDGGECEIGVESTIVSCLGSAPSILRLGAITAEQVAIVSGLDVVAVDPSVRAPGTLAQHYSPRAHVCMEVNEKCEAIIALADVDTPLGMVRLASPDTAAQYAHELYAAMREADHRGYTCIAVIPPSGEGISAAVRDRITRASA